MKSGNAIQDPHSDRVLYIVTNIILILFTLTVMYPLIFIVSCSFSDAIAVSTGRVYLFPVKFSLDGYRAVFSYRRVLTGYINTLGYTLVGTLINITLTLLTAYPLSVPGMQWKKVYLFLFTFTMFFSGGLVPTYLVINGLGMVNTFWSMVIPGAISVYNMIVTRTFIQTSIPISILEAARIDGCSWTKYFFSIVLPLSKAVIAVITLFYAVGHWNAYFNAFIYLNDPNKYPLQLILREILVNNSIEVTDVSLENANSDMKDLLKYSLIVVSTVPVLTFYPFVQRYFIKGVMIGSIKG